MEIKCCMTDIKIIHKFLVTTDANWRNAVYIECRSCLHNKPNLCIATPDFLYAPAANGFPLLLPVSDAEILFSRRLDKTECLLEISYLRFEELFRKYISRSRNNTECPLITICQKQKAALLKGGLIF